MALLYQLSMCLPSFGSYCAIITDISSCYKNNNCHKKETLNYREESHRLMNYSDTLIFFSTIVALSPAVEWGN